VGEEESKKYDIRGYVNSESLGRSSWKTVWQLAEMMHLGVATLYGILTSIFFLKVWLVV
jgi:hypothetical protein